MAIFSESGVRMKNYDLLLLKIGHLCATPGSQELAPMFWQGNRPGE